MEAAATVVDQPRRLHIAVRGAVQGVGFRPFVYREARRLGLRGWVANDRQGVQIEVEGSNDRLCEFLVALQSHRPPRAVVHGLVPTFLDAAGYASFEIRESDEAGATNVLVLPDVALCDDCRREILDPNDRRYRYPFTNCTNCGPRYSIIEALPYDRPSTTMREFVMCPECRVEYHDPLDRRFHAQPNACPACGPHLELWLPDGTIVATHDGALRSAAAAVIDGAIVAVKGLGGFHLIVDATNEDAVAKLRARKHREEKPLAIMVASVEDAARLCAVSDIERQLLASAEAPIMLLDRRDRELSGGGLGAESQAVARNNAPNVASNVARNIEPSIPPNTAPNVARNIAPDVAPNTALNIPPSIAPNVAPALSTLGVMLAYTPLHVLLLDAIGRPVVATSGNLSDEPICFDNGEALGRLGAIADLLLVHDRSIARHVDDSIVRVIGGRASVLRRARGYAPLPVRLDAPDGALAVGAQQKSAVALAAGGSAFISQHIGDLDSAPATTAFTSVVGSLERLYRTDSGVVACDEHPDYFSTRYASALGRPLVRVQHHYAHLLSCMTDNDLEGPVLGVTWDGTGYGSDGTIWGGEMLAVAEDATTPFERVAHLRTFRLVGGDAAVREPRRVALSILDVLYGDDLATMNDLPTMRAFCPTEVRLLRAMMERGVNAPITSSAGRLFDAIASIAGLRQRARHEGQAAIELEHAIGGCLSSEAYEIPVRHTTSASGPLGKPPTISASGPLGKPSTISASGPPGPMILDWAPMIRGIVDDVRDGVALPVIAVRAHNALVEAMVAVAQRTGIGKIALSGGCFQNRYLTERAIMRLRQEGFDVYWHRQVPPNDGGIALGQLAAVRRGMMKRSH